MPAFFFAAFISLKVWLYIFCVHKNLCILCGVQIAVFYDLRYYRGTLCLIIYELRIKLMEKLGKLPSGFFTDRTQGGIKKILSDYAEQVEIFAAHHMCDIAVAVATPGFTLIYLFVMNRRLALMNE